MYEIRKETLLNYPDPTQDYVLQTDASDKAIGAVLLHGNKLIGFYSDKLKGSEFNYNTIEKETFALVKSLLYFKNIIYNSKVTIKTDNMNLLAQKPATDRINRWKLILEELNLELQHIYGTKNVLANLLFKILSDTTNHSD